MNIILRHYIRRVASFRSLSMAPKRRGGKVGFGSGSGKTLPPGKQKSADKVPSNSTDEVAAYDGTQAWLMKAEPDSRIEKGIDVAFGIDKFEAMPQRTTIWDGVRNPEAKTMMKEKMKIGDRVLFYHSNCKLPGIAGLAHVVKEGYPDHTAWDAKHPYFDAKTDKDNPKWFMVDVQLDKRLTNLVPLALLQTIRDDKSKVLDYLTTEHRNAISAMQLLNRGRLSVQRVEPLAYEAIVMLGERGGWQGWPGKWQGKIAKRKEDEESEPVAVKKTKR